MQFHKKTVAVSATALTIVGGIAFAYVTVDGTGFGWGGVYKADGEIRLTANLSSGDLDGIFDDSGNTAVGAVKAENTSSEHTYKVKLTDDTSVPPGGLTVTVTDGDGDPATYVDDDGDTRKCADLLTAVTVNNGRQPVRMETRGVTVGRLTVIAGEATDDGDTSPCLDTTVTVWGLTSH